MDSLTTALRYSWQRLLGCTCAACGVVSDKPVCSVCLRASSSSAEFVVHEMGGATFGRVFSLGRYFACSDPSPLALALIKFKYLGDRGAGHALRRLFRDAAAGLPRGLDLVVPVPLHTRRLRERKYNQAAWLARGAASALKAPLDARALVRVKDTHPQATSAAAARRTLKHAFRSNARLVDTRSILLVDDVYTTGATAADAARALLDAGAARVEMAVLLLAGTRRSRHE